MKKIAMLLSFLMLPILCGATQYNLVTNATVAGWTNSLPAELNAGEQTSLKNLLCQFAGAGANIRVQVQVGTIVSGNTSWVTTADFVMTELAGTWTYTLLGAAVGIVVNNPLYLRDDSLARKVRIRYNITSGTITRIMLETAQ